MATITADLAPVRSPAGLKLRPSVRGKFIWVGEEKFYVRGVTYGPFRPARDGSAYPDPKTVERDFAQIAASGMNAVRTYDVPPRWLLDLAERQGLRVMVGQPARRHVVGADGVHAARR